MRSTFNGLNTMVKGIFANQLSLDTVGHNIVNASTEGYSRQRVDLAASRTQLVGSIYGDLALGTGVDSTAIVRARDIYADKQYRIEVANQEYNKVMQKNYQKLETVFNDSKDSGIQTAMEEFYNSWVALSAHASDNSYREDVVSKGGNLSDMIQTASTALRDQIEELYDDMAIRVGEINDLTEKIVLLNKQVLAQEAGGANANDLRDQRDLLTDQLAEYIDITVTENSNGSYSIVTNGATLVNNTARLTLEMSQGSSSKAAGAADYGVSEYSIKFKETRTVCVVQKGAIKGDLDAIDECKYFIDRLATMAAFMLSTFNEQHKAGLDLNGGEGENFFGRADRTYNYKEYRESYDYDAVYNYLTYTDTDGSIREISGVQIITELEVNPTLTSIGGAKYVAARSHYDANGNDLSNLDDLTATADGSNAVLLSDFFNMNRTYTEASSKKVQHLYTQSDQFGDTVYKISSTGTDDGTVVYYMGDDIEMTDGTVRQTIWKGGSDVVYKYTPAMGDVYYTDNKGHNLDYDSTTGKATGTDTKGNKITYNVGDATALQNVPVYYTADGTVLVTKDVSGASGSWNDGVTKSDPTEDGTINVTIPNEVDPLVLTPYKEIRATDDISINAYYNASMTQLGIRAESMNLKVDAQDDLMVQISNWRSTAMGVDWNEELTNMIKFQKGFGACARCLTAMDEMLDRLVNSTGMVGR